MRRRCELQVLGCNILVSCGDQDSFDLIRKGYSAFLSESSSDPAKILRCDIRCSEEVDGWNVHCGDSVVQCQNSADLLYSFEKLMTLWVQMQRPDLFFVHAAALSNGDRCVVISGASGSDKSSLAWSLSHLGFQYLSDELAPIHPARMDVEPYPHALCLKTEPDSGPLLPESTVYTSATMHVPVYALDHYAIERPSSIGALVFVDASRNGCTIELAAIGSAEAAARLYANGLNQLAHPSDGLPAAIQIAESVPSILITGGTVEERSRAIQDLL